MFTVNLNIHSSLPWELINKRTIHSQFQWFISQDFNQVLYLDYLKMCGGFFKKRKENMLYRDWDHETLISLFVNKQFIHFINPDPGRTENWWLLSFLLARAHFWKFPVPLLFFYEFCHVLTVWLSYLQFSLLQSCFWTSLIFNESAPNKKAQRTLLLYVWLTSALHTVTEAMQHCYDVPTYSTFKSYQVIIVQRLLEWETVKWDLMA